MSRIKRLIYGILETGLVSRAEFIRITRIDNPRAKFLEDAAGKPVIKCTINGDSLGPYEPHQALVNTDYAKLDTIDAEIEKHRRLGKGHYDKAERLDGIRVQRLKALILSMKPGS